MPFTVKDLGSLAAVPCGIGTAPCSNKYILDRVSPRTQDKKSMIDL